MRESTVTLRTDRLFNKGHRQGVADYQSGRLTHFDKQGPRRPHGYRGEAAKAWREGWFAGSVAAHEARNLLPADAYDAAPLCPCGEPTCRGGCPVDAEYAVPSTSSAPENDRRN